MSSYDTSETSGLTRSRPPQSATAPHWFIKLLALVILLLCVAIGMAGIILPVIPGLLFLAVAVIIAARLFPPLGRRLRRNEMFAPYMAKSDHFTALSLQGKVKFAFWLLVKILWDSLVLLVHYTSKLIAWLRKDTTGF
jgi:uncharacterized membrane protein YbaN (DUF454 family)